MNNFFSRDQRVSPNLASPFPIESLPSPPPPCIRFLAYVRCTSEENNTSRVLVQGSRRDHIPPSCRGGAAHHRYMQDHTPDLRELCFRTFFFWSHKRSMGPSLCYWRTSLSHTHASTHARTHMHTHTTSLTHYYLPLRLMDPRGQPRWC